MKRALKILISISVFIASLLSGFLVLAGKQTYSLEYADSSEKGPALSNINIKGQIFRNGTPGGYFNSRTDSNGAFLISVIYNSNIHIEILRIAGEENLKMKCHGSSTINNSKIIIQCSDIDLTK